jgi:hypothetical protein
LYQQQNTHSCAIGQTGCGKTTGYIYPNLNQRLKEGHGILFFDYKGKEHAAVKALAKRNFRLNDTVEIGVPWGAKINLIKYMNEAEIRELTIAIMGLSEKDAYWTNTGSNIVCALWNVMRGYIAIVDAAKELNLKAHFEEPLKRYSYPLDLTFRAFAEITATKEQLTKFVIYLPKVIKKFKSTLEMELRIAFNEDSEQDVREEFEELTMEVMNFIDIVANDILPLKVFEEAKNSGNTSTTFQTIILAMSTTFGAISEVDAFNEDSIDLIEELNNHKIVIINTKELHSSILSSFVNSLFNELTKRIVQPNLSSISVFIDEAQRVMNASTDIHIDVLREAKVDIFLAFQNTELMIESVGETKFAALFQNFSKIFYFKNILNFKDYKTDDLEEFEYYSDNKNIKNKAVGLFLDDNELYEAQREYFILNDAYEILNIQEHYKKGILLFNSHLFSKKQIQILDKNGNIEIVKIKDTTAMKKADIFMRKAFFDFIEEEKEDEIEFESSSKITSPENAEKILDLFRKKTPTRSEKAKEKYEKAFS